MSNSEKQILFGPIMLYIVLANNHVVMKQPFLPFMLCSRSCFFAKMLFLLLILTGNQNLLIITTITLVL